MNVLTRHSAGYLLIIIVLSFAFAPSWAGCQSSPADGSDGGLSDSQVPPSGPLALTAHDAYQTEKVGDIPSRPDERYVVVELTIINRTTEALPLVAGLFSLIAESGLEYIGHPATSALSSGCPENAKLGSGKQTRCAIAFAAPATVKASAVSLRVVLGPAQHYEATTAVKVIRCSSCGDSCRLLDRDADHCGACNQSVGAGRCVGGKAVCEDNAELCGNRCVDLQTDPQHCGACNRPAHSGGSCVGGKPSCASGLLTCNAACVDISTDPRHCGKCDNPVGQNAECIGGKSVCSSGYRECGLACVNTSSDRQNCGQCGKICPSGYSCGRGSFVLTKCRRAGTPAVGQSCTALCQSQGTTCAAASYYNSAGRSTFDVGCWEAHQSWMSNFICHCEY
ncbi:MAG: hypothetical protein H6707_10720 [Deltaproteobacteria bacterium]|nr:hypothetical protein [Deltaproteobacteria bacterium]